MWGQKITVHGGRLVVLWAAIPHPITQCKITRDAFVEVVRTEKMPGHFCQYLLADQRGGIRCLCRARTHSG